MGKKSKANRKKAPVATAVATAAATPPAAVAAVATSAATATTAAVVKAGSGVNEFPESTFHVKAESFHKKGNHSKANKILVQGIENGCVRCLFEYTMKILNDGATRENTTTSELINNNMNPHLALPLFLEGAIRGYPDAVTMICGVYGQANGKDGCRYGHWRSRPADLLTSYWQKIRLKDEDREERIQTKKVNKKLQEHYGVMCSLCGKEDSETVTLMKCDGCKFYYYCSKECQKKMWQEGQHAGVCRHLGLLNKYHKPFAKKIRRDLVEHRLAPRDIPELQELRQRLGLCRPQVDYQDLLEAAKTQQLDPAQLILPRKDGTVQIGSFPRPI